MIPPKQEGFDNAYQMVRALETKRQCRLTIWVANDKGMIIVPKDEVTLPFIQEADKLKRDKRRACQF